jgi:hypothetical protein
MSDRRGKVLSFGPFDLSIGNMHLGITVRRAPWDGPNQISGPPELWTRSSRQVPSERC